MPPRPTLAGSNGSRKPKPTTRRNSSSWTRASRARRPWRTLRAHTHRHRHHLPGWRHQVPVGSRQDPARVRAQLHRLFLHRARRLRVRRGPVPGYNAEKRSYDKSSWDYERGDDGYVKTDPTLEHPRCVYQLLKKHYSRYTEEMVERVCGTPKDKFLKVCDMLASTATRIAPPPSCTRWAGRSTPSARRSSVPARWCSCCWAISASPAAA